jgi:ABC-type phosphate/phosphonate transport system ATPase subunit
MKIYTNVIKMLEKGLRVLVVGDKCSGKSTLLKEISNF